MTPAQELQAAATKLRADRPYGALGEPLAVWLTWLGAWNHDPSEKAVPGTWECPACGDLDVIPERCPAWPAYKVAAVINRRQS